MSLFLLLPVPALSKVFLVSVGIADYPGSQNDLTLCADDARMMTSIYSKNQELTYCQLLDSNATKSKIIAAMNKVFQKAGENDIVVLFYSGHGYPGGFCVYDGNLSYEEVRKSMAKSKCKNKMIFADACFSGKIRKPSPSDTDITATKNANVMLFLSSRSHETSLENPNMHNGYFTTFLHKGLRGNADTNRDRKITAKELFNYVSSNVARFTDNKQHPVMWGHFPEDMPVMIWKEKR